MSKLGFINDFLQAFAAPKGSLQLLGLVANQLVSGQSADANTVVLKTLTRLFSKGDFKLPADVLAKGTVDSQLLDSAKTALSAVLGKAGQSTQVGTPEQVLAGAKWILENRLDACGGTSQVPLVPGPETPMVAGRHSVAIWIETDANKMPLLPAIKTSLNPNHDARNARAIIFNAIPAWSGKLKVDFDTAGTPDTANLFITGEDFGQKGISSDVLALTDIGPLFGQKCRMVFDLRQKDLSEADFRYTFIHEFGHALGVKHADVALSGALMSPIRFGSSVL